MIPVVALVGRPNVGKSTLFNRLTKTKDALVADFAGLTRDRKYGQATFENFNFIVIDTGGLDGDESGIFQKMAEQSLAAIDEADAIWFLVDARAGVNAADEAIAQYLRTTEKPVFIVANKCDGIDANIACNEFYALALGEIYPIAASHGRGVRSLLEHQAFFEAEPAISLPEDSPEQQLTGDDSDHTSAAYLAYLQTLPIKLAIVGRPNVGKSTLTNRILGEERVVVYDMPGTTRDSIYIPMERDGQAYTLIDTAGVRRRKKVHEAIEKFSIVKTLRA
ncbi:MAG: ribosome biogenesis GTPase Der, partial [Shewanellaceae bacterium]|nr:ribosome biogenesis GTPase Der [Shewanellaceae bacterium]